MAAQQYLASSSNPKVSSLKGLLVGLILLGIFFRFANLDKKIYWHDEAYTSLHLSGYSVQEMDQRLFNGQLLTVDDIQQFQRLSPTKTVADTVALLATYDAQHPPLYYVLARLWASLFGDSVSSIRGVSALLSLLALSFAYWLGWELFQSSVTASILTGLIAISPFHILYAQEAREYGLWTVMILFSCAALLRALRKPSHVNWAIYALSLTLGLYTFLFTVLVMLAHGIYVVATQHFKITRVVAAYLLATGVSILLFTPWLINLVINSSRVIRTTAWLTEPKSLLELVRSLVANATRVLADFNFAPSDPLILLLPTLIVLAAIISYALFFLCRKAPAQVWLFVLLLGGVTALFLIIPDVVFGGHRSSISRYVIPTWLGIQMAVAYWMGFGAGDVPYKPLQKIAIALILSASLLSNFVSMQSEAWWTKYSSQHHLKTAQIINQAEQPLLISSDFYINKGELLSLSHSLDQHITLLLIKEPQFPHIPDGFSDIFLFNPSPEMQDSLKADGHSVKSIYIQGMLWKVT
ncbi:MAG: glycosyltransferase family 39 protein [Nodosilinea sp.]